jgi:hypothetical protein
VRRDIRLFVSLCLCSGTLQIQGVCAAEVPPASLDALAFLSGHWEGEGWIQQRSPGVQKFHGSEVVEFKAGGKILAITGKHLSSATGEVVHDAFAIISPAADGSSYRFMSFLAAGQSGEFAGRLENGAFIWEMDAPRGAKIRYTIRVVDNEWRESGQYSADGAQWREIFGMTLKRVKSDAAHCE